MENFNSLALEFCNDIISSFPTLEEKVSKTKKLLESKPLTKSFLEYYLFHTVPFMLEVSKMNNEFLIEHNIMIMVGLKFNDLYSLCDENSSNAVWRYLFSLYLTAIDCEDVEDLIEKNKEHRNYERLMVVYRKQSKIGKNIMESSGKIAESMVKKMAEGSEGKTFGDKFSDSDFE